MNPGVYAVVLIPLVAAPLLALIPSYRITAAGNMLACFAPFAAGLSLLVLPRIVGDFVIVDDLNIFFIILNTFVGFTTSTFSASYIGHEIETGKLTPLFVRFYHAMY